MRPERARPVQMAKRAARLVKPREAGAAARRTASRSEAVTSRGEEAVAAGAAAGHAGDPSKLVTHSRFYIFLV